MLDVVDFDSSGALDYLRKEAIYRAGIYAPVPDWAAPVASANTIPLASLVTLVTRLHERHLTRDEQMVLADALGSSVRVLYRMKLGPA